MNRGEVNFNVCAVQEAYMKQEMQASTRNIEFSGIWLSHSKIKQLPDLVKLMTEINR